MGFGSPGGKFAGLGGGGGGAVPEGFCGTGGGALPGFCTEAGTDAATAADDAGAACTANSDGFLEYMHKKLG